jgi:hypothetical protein
MYQGVFFKKIVYSEARKNNAGSGHNLMKIHFVTVILHDVYCSVEICYRIGNIDSKVKDASLWK